MIQDVYNGIQNWGNPVRTPVQTPSMFQPMSRSNWGFDPSNPGAFHNTINRGNPNAMAPTPIDQKEIGKIGQWITGKNADGSMDNDSFTAMQKLFGGQNKDGQTKVGGVNTAMGLGLAGLNGFIGLKQLGLAEKQYESEMSNWTDNFNAQAKTVNQQVESKARYLEQMGYIEGSADEYMNKYKIQEK